MHSFMTVEETPVAAILIFKMMPKYSRQAFVIINISCKFENCTYYTFCFTGVTKLLDYVKETVVVAVLFFKIRPQIFQGKLFY